MATLEVKPRQVLSSTYSLHLTEPEFLAVWAALGITSIKDLRAFVESHAGIQLYADDSIALFQLLNGRVERKVKRV